MRVGLGLLLITALAIDAQDRPIGGGVNLNSPAKEAALGASLAADVRRTTTPLDSAVVRDYVGGLGMRLAGQLPQQPAFHFTFAVIAEPAVAAPLEPLSLPGETSSFRQA